MSDYFPTLQQPNGENIPPLGDQSPQLSKQPAGRRKPFADISDPSCDQLNTLTKIDTQQVKNNETQQLSAASLAAQSLIQEINRLAIKDDKRGHPTSLKKHSVIKRHRRHPSSSNSFASSTDLELSRMTSPSLDSKASLTTSTTSNSSRRIPKRHHEHTSSSSWVQPNDTETKPPQEHQGYLDFAAFKKLKYKTLSESPEQQANINNNTSQESSPTTNHKANTKTKRERYTNLKLDLAHRAAASKVASKAVAQHIGLSQTAPSTPTKDAASDHKQSLPVPIASATTLAYMQGKTFTLNTGQKVQVRVPVMSQSRCVEAPADISIQSEVIEDSQGLREDAQTKDEMTTPQTELRIGVQFPDLKDWANHMQQVREKRLLELGVTRSRPSTAPPSSASPLGESYNGVDMASRRSSINSGLNIGMGSPQMDSSNLGGNFRMSSGMVVPPYYSYDGEDNGETVGAFQVGPVSPFRRSGSPGLQLEGAPQFGPGSPATASFLNPTSYPVIDSYSGATGSSFYDQQQDTVYYQDPTGALYQQGAFNFQQRASRVLSGDFVFQPKVKKVVPIVDPETKTSLDGDKLTSSPVKQNTKSDGQKKSSNRERGESKTTASVFDNIEILLEEVSKEVEPLHDLLRRHFDNLERQRKKRKMNRDKSRIHDEGYEAESDSDSDNRATSGGDSEDDDDDDDDDNTGNEARLLWNPSKLIGEYDQMRDSLVESVSEYIINHQRTVSATSVGKEEAVGYMGGALDSLFEQVEQRDTLLEKIEGEHNETVESLEREIRTRQLEVDALKTQLEEFCNEEKELQIQRDMDLQRLFQANEREKSKLRKENEQSKQKIKEYEMELQVERVLNRDRQDDKGQQESSDKEDNNNNNNNEMMNATRTRLLELEKTVQNKDSRIDEMNVRLKRTEQEMRAQSSWVASMASSQISNIEDLLLLLRQPGDIDRNGLDEVAVKIQGFLEVQKLSCQKTKLPVPTTSC